MGGRGASSAFSRNNAVSRSKDPQGVTDEYLHNATPGKGTIIIDDNYNIGRHKEEISVAEILHNKFGGDIHLINDKGASSPSPDYIWHDKLWELKSITVSTNNATDSAVRKALKQINQNPGGLILKYKSKNISENIINVISNRVRRSGTDTIDVILLNDNEVFKILRYKK